MEEIKVYSFFSGCGLLDLGFEQAGFNIAMVSEKHSPFLDAYKYSREKMNLYLPEDGYRNDDIKEYLKEDSEFSNLIKERKKGSFIGFIGGPPCPDFSTAGKNKGEKGGNGKLTRIYFQLVCKDEPDFFVFENVKGLWKTKKHREFYDKMLRMMKRQGYFVMDKLLNSLEYGVPQERERVFMVGIKTKTIQEKALIKALVRDFAWGIKDKNMLEVIKNTNWPNKEPFVENSSKAMPDDLIEELTIQYWFNKNDVINHPNAQDYFKPQRGLARMQIVEEGDVSKKSYKRLHRWRYSPTAAYGNNEVHLHPFKCRRLSVSEVLSIQSAPKEFRLPPDMSLTDKFKTVGNGVPVLMAEKFAIDLKLFLEEFIRSREDKIL